MDLPYMIYHTITKIKTSLNTVEKDRGIARWTRELFFFLQPKPSECSLEPGSKMKSIPDLCWSQSKNSESIYFWFLGSKQIRKNN